MKDRRNATLDIHQNVASLAEPLCVAADLVEFFLDGFIEEMAHDNSLGTRKRLRTIITTLLKDFDELCGVLNSIDPDRILEWRLGYCDFDEDDSE